ncbi:MAG: PAS domain-containing sensor histidine kinase, partial [Sphingomonadales bacterium]
MEVLIDREDSLRQAVDFIPQGLAAFDRDLRLVTANNRYRDVLALPVGLVAPGTPLYDIALFLARRGDLGPGDATYLAAQRVQELTGSPHTVTQRLGALGQTLEFYSSRLPNGGLVISFSDVTDRVAAESEIADINLSLEGRVEERTADLVRVNSELEIARAKADAANRDKTRFLAAASHDLLQPLNAARLYTATLVERAGGTGLDDLASSIEQSLTAVEEIMSALLDISRLDAGAMKPTSAPFQIRDLLKKIDVEFAPLAEKKQVRLRLVETCAAAVGDRALVARVVQNLVSNAIKYTRPGGQVLVGVRKR